MAYFKSKLIPLLLVAACFVALPVPSAHGDQDESSRRSRPPHQPAIKRLATTSLPNAYRLDANVISGGEPDGEAGFRELQRLGVKTVISVDGAKPNVSLAKHFHLRYVHLPHGYDGIPDQRIEELARAITDLPGPIYIHCHHGMHRSPVAAAVACISNGRMSPQDGRELLRMAGTSHDYKGLHQVVADAKPIPRLDRLEVDFHETVEVPPMAKAMVHLAKTFDHLKTIEASGWMTPVTHPDLTPVHEAVLLREHFSELLRTDEVRGRDKAFDEIMKRSQTNSESLAQQLRDKPVLNQDVRRQLSATLAKVKADCKSCHRNHRD